MSSISQLSTNSIWKKLYSLSSATNMKSGNLQQDQSDYNFQSLQALSNFTIQNIQTQQEQYRNRITTFNNSVSETNKSAKLLTAANFFNQKYVSTSTGAAVSGDAKSGATETQYNVSVSQVATGQQNDGKTLTGSAYGGVSTGLSTLGITVGSGTERQVSVNILATDTNGQALKKFASAINNSGNGVRAEVKTKGNDQYLSVISKDTGAANSFAIRDIYGNGATTLQLTNTVKNSADASYVVNGTNYQSSTNKVSLDHGNLTLSLNSTTTGTIKVNVGKDDSKVVDAVKNLVTNYNKLNDVLSDSDYVTKRGGRALDGVESLVGKTMSSNFASIGITLDKTTGSLALDDKKISTALASSPDKVKSLLIGSASLGKIVERVSKEISTAPVNSYLKPPSALDTLNYTSPYNSNGWLTKNNNLAQGLFLNMTV
ncbi:flagellar filament capping protein FliD [Pelosinus sp. sgz500959]|uniref:flagellar filament capping protein FliD n=1 Tax=Pelosinus sp. sgz500959 TaxID=3242472 RepID=UPI00366EB2AE